MDIKLYHVWNLEKIVLREIHASWVIVDSTQIARIFLKVHH